MRFAVLLCIFLLLPCTATAAAPRMLFDQGHRQAFVIEKEGPLQLSGLAELFLQHGWQVEKTTGRLTGQALTDVDALIISGAFSPLNPDEVEAVLNFLQRGGRLAVMIHIGQPLLPLLHKLGVDAGNRVINENQQQPDGKTSNFMVHSFNPHPLTENLQSFAIYGGWPLRVFSRQGEYLAGTSPQAWVDMNQDRKLSKGDLVDRFNVLVAGTYGRGGFAVFADDAIFQNRFLQGGNKTLAANLSSWLRSPAQTATEI